MNARVELKIKRCARSQQAECLDRNRIVVVVVCGGGGGIFRVLVIDYGGNYLNKWLLSMMNGGRSAARRAHTHKNRREKELRKKEKHWARRTRKRVGRAIPKR